MNTNNTNVNQLTNTSISTTTAAFACNRCAERKVKCDRKSPCSTCTRHRVPCTYRTPRSSRTNRKATEEIIRRYEKALREKGINPDEIHQHSSTSQAEDNSSKSLSKNTSTTSHEHHACGKGAINFRPQVLKSENGTNFVDNILWYRIAEEFQNGNTLDEDSDDDVDENCSQELLQQSFLYLLNIKPSSKLPSHPSSPTIYRLLQAFTENVNPLVKMVHIPTLKSAIDKAVININSMNTIPKGFEAFMFSIYSIAVLSLTDSQCQEICNQSKAHLLPYFVNVTKLALSKAKFMSTTSLVVLQALFLHIMSVRDTEQPRAVWNLTGLCIRIAETMGLHFDGSILGLSPFETEIRRRLWWQIRMHDSRAAELCGQTKFRNFEVSSQTPKMPLNLEDKDLHPSMKNFPPEQLQPTEMIWCLFRAELTSFATGQMSKAKITQENSNVASIEVAAMIGSHDQHKMLHEIIDKLETKFLRFCDPSLPLHFYTLLCGRLSTNLIQFMLHHPRKWKNLPDITTETKNVTWDLALSVLDKYNMIQTTAQIQCFAWNIPYFIQWHAVTHVLDVLRVSPLHAYHEKAWNLLQALYHNNSNILYNTNKPIYLAVGNLCLRVFAIKEMYLKNEGKPAPTVPDFITKLRQLRDMLKQKSKRSSWSNSNHVPTDAAAPETQLGLPSIPGNTRTEDDTFWLNQNFEDHGDSHMESVIMDDSISANSGNPFDQPFWPSMMSFDDQGIDWAQWDNWIANS